MDCARGGRDLVLFPNRCFFCRFGKLAPTLELISGDVEMISTTGGRVCRRTRWSRLAARSRYHYSTYNYNVIPAINVAGPFIKHDLLFLQSPCSRFGPSSRRQADPTWRPLDLRFDPRFAHTCCSIRVARMRSFCKTSQKKRARGRVCLSLAYKCQGISAEVSTITCSSGTNKLGSPGDDGVGGCAMIAVRSHIPRQGGCAFCGPNVSGRFRDPPSVDLWVKIEPSRGRGESYYGSPPNFFLAKSPVSKPAPGRVS